MSKTVMSSESPEEESLTLLDEFVSEIAHALNSLAGKPPNSVIDKYQFWSCKHLHRAAEGFVFLRRSRRVDASKILIRPAIEILFRVTAIRKNAALFYRIAFSEHRRDKQLLQIAEQFGAFGTEQIKNNRKTFRENWERFQAAFTAHFPDLPKEDRELTIAETAEHAGMTRFYSSHYRIYCQYTHGALRASFGSLDEATDWADNRTMAICALGALNGLVSMGAESPRHERLVRRLSDQG